MGNKKYSIAQVATTTLKTDYGKAAGALEGERLQALQEIYNAIGTTGLPIVNSRSNQVLANFHDVQTSRKNDEKVISVVTVDIPVEEEVDFFAKLTNPPKDGQSLFERGQLLGNYYRDGEGKRLRMERRDDPKAKPEDHYAPFMGYSRPQIKKLVEIGLKAPDLLTEINVTETVSSAYFLMQKRLKRKSTGDDDTSDNATDDKFFVNDPELEARIVGIVEKLKESLTGEVKLNRLIESKRDKEGVDYAIEDEHGFGYMKYFPKPEEVDEELLPKEK